MSAKRPLQSTSPEITDSTPKKRIPYINMSSNAKDVFSWDKLGEMLDEKLKDVAKKEDLIEMRNEIRELQQENIQLKEEMKKLTSRLEIIDRRSRSSNVVVSGLTCTSSLLAKKEFTKICTEIMNVDVDVVTTRMVGSGRLFIFTLGSCIQTQKVLSAKRNLNGKNIFIQRDYTESEQSIRYNMRKLKNEVLNKRINVNVRLAEFSIYINEKRFNWSQGKIIAASECDAAFLKEIIGENVYDIISRDSYNNDTVTYKPASQ